MTIFIGKDENEAVQSAMAQLDVNKDQLTITIVQTARRGFLGLGKRPAKIDVTVKQVPETAHDHKQVKETKAASQQPGKQEPHEGTLATTLTPEEQLQKQMAENHRHNLVVMKAAAQGLQDYLKAIYQQLGIKVTPVIQNIGAHSCEVNLKTDKTGQVVGYHGRRINAVEQLGAAYLNYQGVHDVMLILDSGDYRTKRREALAKILERSITQVIATNQAVFFDPMPVRERKYLHKRAEQSSQVRTYSHGREPFRSIVIAPKN